MREELEKILGRELKILVVDDTKKNIEAAKVAFKELNVDYFTSPSDAIASIKSNYESGKRYSLVLSDLEMHDDSIAGLEVVKEAFRHNTYGLIVTGVNYDKPDNVNHGPITTIIPRRLKSVKGKKEKPEVWSKVLDNSINYLTNERIKSHLGAIERNEEHVGKPSLFSWGIIYPLYLDAVSSNETRLKLHKEYELELKKEGC